jgi:uncharacterized membrane protein YdbT with pleckstrin-like domain
MAKDEELIPGEEVLATARRHPIVLVQRVWWQTLLGIALAVAAAILIPRSSGNLRWFVASAIVVLLFIYIDIQWIVWRSVTYTITTQRVILRRGIFRNVTRLVSLSRVQDVTTSQSLVGRMLGYGTVELESAGKDGAEVLDHMPHPEWFRKVLFEHIHAGPAQPAQNWS